MAPEPTQLYFDLDGNIKEPGKKKKIKKHPFNDERSLEAFKGVFLSPHYLDNSILLKSPLLCESQELYNEDLLKDFIKWDSRAIEDKSLIENAPKISLLDNFNKDLNSINTDGEQTFKYFINYYFKEPLETKEDKIAYINQMETLELPKKYIYNVWTKEGTTKKLNIIDKEALGLMANESENWKYKYKPYLEKFFNALGIQELKKYYDSIPFISEEEKDEIDTYNNRIKYKEYNFFNHFILDSIIQEAITDNHEIIDYKTYLEFTIKRDTKRYESSLATYKEKEKYIIDTLKKINKTQQDLEIYISTKENLDYKEAFKRDKSRYNYLSGYYYNREEYKEDIAYIEALKNAPEDSLESIYFKLLELDFYYTYFVWLVATRLKNNKDLIERVKDINSYEAYCNNMAKEFLAPKYRYRDLEKKETALEIAKGNIATYSNNVIETLKFSSAYVKKLDGSKLEDYNQIKEDIETLNIKISGINDKLKNPGLDYEERERLEQELETLKQELNSLMESKKDKGYITINNNPYSLNLASNHNQLKEVKIEETKDSIIVVLKDFKRIIPKNFTILTKKNNKDTYKEASLEELTPTIATKLQALTSIIIDTACNSHDNKILLNTNDTLLKLGYDPNSTDKKRYIYNLKFMLTYLQYQKISNIYLKGAFNPKTNKKENKLMEEYASLSFISSFLINSNEIAITIEELLIKGLYEHNKSKYWKPKDLDYNTPEQRLLNERAYSLMNQAKISNDGIIERNLTIESLILTNPSYRDKIEDLKHYERNLATPLFNDFNILNMTPSNTLEYNSKDLLGVKTIRTKEDLKRTIGVKYRENSTPQKLINRQEQIKLNKESKKKKGSR